jgi:hypothetical protein
MALTREEAISRARRDLSSRLGIPEEQVTEDSVTNQDFPDTSLGASTEDEMSGQMITPGWRIRLRADGQVHEYRADKRQLRLVNYNGSNFLI